MIGLVGIAPPTGAAHGTVTLDSLPRIPAERLAALVARADGEDAVERLLAWFRKLMARRPTFTLGLVARPEECAAALGVCVHPVRLVLPPEALIQGALPRAALAVVRNASVEGILLEEFHRDNELAVVSQRTLVECLISHAVRGGSVNAVAADLGCSTITVWRRVARFGLKPGALMTRIRLRAFEVRVELGVHPDHARRAGGWYTRRAWEKAVARDRVRKRRASAERNRGGR